MARSAGLEPALTRLEVGGLIQLDDERINLFTSLFIAEIELFVNLFFKNGALGENRTPCLRVTNPAHRQQCF